MARDYIQEAKDARKTFKGTNGEFVEKVGKPAMEAHNKAAKSKAMEKKKESTKERHVRYAKEDRFTKGMHEMNSRNHIQIDN